MWIMGFEKKPMRANELSSFENFSWALSAIKQAESDLGKRLELVGKKRNVKRIASELANIYALLLRTVQTEKLITLKKNLENQTMKIVTKRSTSSADDGFAYVEKDCLKELCRIATTEECLICEGKGNNKAKCKLRKSLKGIFIDEMDEQLECIGKQLMTKL